MSGGRCSSREQGGILDQGWRLWLLVLGAAVFILPTLIALAQYSWRSEQGAYGPIILAIGIWLLVRQWHEARPAIEPPPLGRTLVLLGPILLVHGIARLMHWTIVDAFTLWAVLVVVGYGLVGLRSLRMLMFPVMFLLFAFPPPEAVISTMTQPARLLLADAAVALLKILGYPMAQSGLSIFVGQYELLVKDACSGLNSLISLAAIGSFFAYTMYGPNWRFIIFFSLVMVFVAILVNFLRILLLILITYHLGNSAGQGYLHEFAGISLFMMAMLGMLLADRLAAPVRRSLGVV